MRKLVLLICVLSSCAAFGGEAPGKQDRKAADRPNTLPAEFFTLRAALGLLRLSEAEQVKAGELGLKYDKQLADELARARTAVNERLLAELREGVTPEHKTQLDGVLAAMKKRDESVKLADEKLEAVLKDLAPGDMRVSRGQVRNEQQLLEKLVSGQPGLREKIAEAKAKSEKSKADAAVALTAPIDPSDRTAVKVHREAKEKIEQEAHTQYLSDLRNLLTEEQRAALGKALAAQKLWQEAAEKADQVYKEEVKAALGLDRNKPAERKPR